MTPALPATTPPLFVRNGLTLDDATFTLARVAQPAAAMTFDGTQTIDGTGTLVFQGQPSVRVNGGTLSIGARVSEADSR